MIKQTLSIQVEKSDETGKFKRADGETNIDWIKRAYEQFSFADVTQWSFIILAGGKDVTSFRIRVAQSHLRSDMLPSYWSDCALLKIEKGDFAAASFFTLPLFQPATETYAPTRNGVVESAFINFPSRKIFPNLALLAIPVAQAKILASLKKYQSQRVSYDAVENILPWLAFVWGAGNATNPLMQYIGLPSAVMLSQLFGVQGFDLAPGVNASLSSPEIFWGSVKYWYDSYSKTQQDNLGPRARFVIDHKYDIDEY